MKLSTVDTLALDFDGVLTDGMVYVDQDGRESVRCSRRDGHGIAMLREAGVRVLVISRERNAVVAARCAKLKIEHEQACDEKAIALRRLVPDLERTAYVGDDLPDLECLAIVGVPCCVADAEYRVVDHVQARHGVLIPRCGGAHAVRWLANAMLTERAEASR